MSKQQSENKTVQNDSVIICQDLTKNFHDGSLYVEVLQKVNLSVKKGERLAIVGASGAGKSTFLHILGGLDKPTSGHVLINGHDMTQLNDAERSRLRNRTLGFIYQFHHLLPEFTVLENVCMPLLLRHSPIEEAKEKAFALLEKIGLAKRYNHKLAELSGGERQRTAIARALITDPVCVLADEPTGNLDKRTAERVYASMLELNQALNMSIIIVTHDMHLAEQMDHIYLLENGHLIRQ